MQQHEIEHIEINLFLEAIYQRYGYDFRQYARASIQRRIRRLLSSVGLDCVSAMLPALLHDPAFLPQVVDALSINVSEMFRDPAFFLALRREVVPYLRTYPFIKVWHAGCASGEEVYSLAILFKEEGLYERTTFFATDINAGTLSMAKAGIYPIDRIQTYTANYQKAGGKAAFSDYFHAQYDSAIMEGVLKKNITFAPHNLATDSVFGEMHLIICRNVLIYFDAALQARVLGLFDESLIHGGILALGSKETHNLPGLVNRYEPVSAKWRVFKKTSDRPAHQAPERSS